MASVEKVMFAEERRRQIVELIHAEKKIVIPELCNRFGVSASTIRNDLRDLQDEGLITRTHGGAIINSKSGYELLPLDKEARMAEAKRAIGRKAAELVEDGDIIAIGPGTTMLEMAKCLDPAKELTIILNDLPIAAYLERFEKYRIILLGGTLRKNFHYTRMMPGGESLVGVNIDKAFISGSGTDVKRGVTTPDPGLAHDLRLIIQAASEVYILSDSSKFGSVTFSRIVSVDGITAIITDSGIGDDDFGNIRNAGVELLIG